MYNVYMCMHACVYVCMYACVRTYRYRYDAYYINIMSVSYVDYLKAGMGCSEGRTMF